MENYTHKLSKTWWNTYGKKSGLGTVVDIYDILENDDSVTHNDRIIINFKKDNTETFVLFNNYELIAESTNVDDLIDIPQNSTNMMTIAANKQLSKHNREFIKSMVATHDEEYKEKALVHRQMSKNSYQHRFDTATRKSNHYLRLLENINKGKVKKPLYAYTNYAKKVEHYHNFAKNINKAIAYESQLIKLVDNTTSSTSQK